VILDVRNEIASSLPLLAMTKGGVRRHRSSQ
jgi:hypothetical protein